MAGKFKGWLLKFGTVVLPNTFMEMDGWSATPNQRTELEAYRDANVLLHRETSGSYKTKITITVREMNLTEKTAFQNVVNGAMLSMKERKISLSYWNDETNDYSSGVFYIPDIVYKIHLVDEKNNDIEYAGFSLTMIEY